MFKRILLPGLLAALAAVSCMKATTDAVMDAAGNEMTFRIHKASATKGSELTGTILPRTYGIYVAGTQKDAHGVIENPNFFSGTEQLFGTTEADPTGATDARLWHAGAYSGGVFSASPLYWPIGNVKLDYLAYAMPMASRSGVASGDWLAVWDNRLTDAASQLTFYDVDTYANQEDVLYAVANGQSNTVNGGSGNSVRMAFDHAQALLIFNVRVNEAASGKVAVKEISYVTPERVEALRADQVSVAAGNASSLAALADADVTLKTVGTFRVDNTRNLPEAYWSFGAGACKKENYKMPSGTGVSSSNSTVQAQTVKTRSVNYNTAVAYAAGEYHQLGQTLLIPEQEKVNFTITYMVNGRTLNYTVNDFRGMWERGKKYVYDLDMTMNEVVVTESVSDFVPQTYSASGEGEVTKVPNYLTFEAIESGSILWKTSNASWVKDIEYCINDGEWVTISPITSGTAIPVNAGDKVWFRGDNAVYGSSSYWCSFSGTSRYYVYGDVSSLLSEGNKETLSDYAFSRLFINDTYLVSHPNKKIEFSTKTLGDYCYQYMFRGCASLTTAPELPATTLGDYCYQYMFQGCTSLTTAPELPATTLGDYCYQYMFQGCTSLTTASELPATTLTEGCYIHMFENCTSLTTAPELPAITLAKQCYDGMFRDCTSLITAPELPAMTLLINCYHMMFYNCTSLTTAPELPAMTLKGSCYSQMFQGCTSLTTAPELPATTLVAYCYENMFSGCTSLTTAPELPATTLANRCYSYMFSGCTSLTTVPELPATTLAEYCYRDMFYRCTSLITAPELPATILSNYCYYNMFKYCSNLSYIKAAFTTIGTGSLTDWVSNVSSTGTFVKNVAATWNVTGANGVPTGWTVETYTP